MLFHLVISEFFIRVLHYHMYCRTARNVCTYFFFCLKVTRVLLKFIILIYTSYKGSAMSKEDIVENDKNSQNESNSKNKIKREKNAPPSKVVIRGLPPTMTRDTFVEQVSPIPDHDYLYFVRADLSLGQFAFSRAYINFLNSEDIFIFTEKFDGYIFVDQKGNEYTAVVEFSPFQKIPKRVSRKKDAKCGTIEADPDYLKFLEQRAKVAETDAGPPSTQEVLEEIEAKERELRAHHGVLKMSTPLLDFLRHRKEEKIRIREEKKEERKRREADRRKMREEERRRPKEVSSYSRDSGKDKSKVDRTPKQLLTHKEKDSQATDAELTKKLKEALKINASHDKQKRETTSRDGAEKDKTSSREKEKSAYREKEHHKEKEGSKDRPEKLREQRSSNKEKDLQWQEREEKRAKQRAEERARRNAARKAAWSEKKEKQEQKSQSASSHKEAKSQQAMAEDKKKPPTADTPKDKQEEAVKSTSSREEVTCEKSDTKLEKSSSEEPMSTKEEQTTKAEDSVSDSKKEEETKKSGASCKPKPERIRNKVGMELTEKGKNIKNKDRPSMQLYRPGMLKKRPSNMTSESAASAASKDGGAKLGAGQESASTSSSSSPTPPASNSSKEKPESKRRSSAPPTKSKPQSADVKSRDSERAKSDDDKMKEDIPVKSRTFKRSFS